MMLKSILVKSLGILLIAGLLAGLGTVSATGAPSDTAPSAPSGVLSFVEADFDSPGLNGATAVAVSPDGAHVYVASNWDDAVAVFRRDSTTGKLFFVEKEVDEVNGVDGLDGATSVVVSPDGAHVYVAGKHDDAVAVFTRNTTTGRIGFLEVKKDSDPDVDYLNGPQSLAISPDGKDLYVVSYYDDSLLHFDRNTSTGRLTWGDWEMEGVGGVTGMLGPYGVAATNYNVYVASLTGDAVAVFQRNTSSGWVDFLEHEQDEVGGVHGLDGARSVAVGLGRVYVASSEDDAVAVFDIEPADGSLTFLTHGEDGIYGAYGLDGAWGVATSGLHVYVASFTADAVVALQYRELPAPWLLHKGVWKDGVDGVDGVDGATAVAASPDGKHVYVTGVADDAVAVFARDSATGALTFVEACQNVDGIADATSVAVSPDGKHVYATGYNDDAVTVFNRSPDTGALSYWETIEDGDGGVNGLDGAYSVVVSPDGKHVYVAGRDDDAVAAFSRDPTTGSLSFVEYEHDGSGGANELNGARSVAISPTGGRVYVASAYDDSLTVFVRNTDTGELTYWDVMKEGVDGVTGLNGAWSVAVSPDGAHMYVAGYTDDTVAVFKWTSGFPVLAHVETEKDGINSVDGLAGASSVAVSPDGKHVYVTGADEHAVAVFDRNSITGELDYVEVQKNGSGGVAGLEYATSVAISPCGGYIYVTGCSDDTLAVFSRNSANGRLSYKGMEEDGVSGVDGLDGAFSVVASPDGKNVYVASVTENAVAVFQRYLVYLPLVIKD